MAKGRGGADGGTELHDLREIAQAPGAGSAEINTILEHIFNFQQCDGYKADGLNAVLRTSNVPDESDAAVCAAINGRYRACPKSFFSGTLVRPGNIGLVLHNGRVEAVPEGRYTLALYRASWIGVFSINENIQQESLTLVRVPRGQVGLAWERKNAILLGEGLHVYNDVAFAFEKLVVISEPHIKHGPLNILRVKKGEYAKVWFSGTGGGLEPKLLREGCHVIDSSLFSFVGRSQVEEMHVSHGALHILQVPKGHVAKVKKENTPELLGEGTHHLESTNFQYEGTANLNDSVIYHGTITVVRVNRGQVGLAWQDNIPLFLEEPGVHSFDTPTFNFVKHASVTDKVIELGTKKIVTVNSGEVAISYDSGELRILHPGRHVIEDAAHKVDGFLPILQKSVRLISAEAGPPRRGAAKEEGSDLLICDTKDLVKVGVRADVFYSIADPEKTIRRVAKEDINTIVLETAIATLTNIIRSTTLNEIAQSKNPSAVSNSGEQVQTAQALGESASAPLFFDKAHDEFLSKLHDDFMARYGIDVTNIRIESFKIMDAELSGNISKQALTTAQTESQLANLAGQTEIATKEQEREAQTRQIKAQAEALATKTEADAKNSALISKSEAEARADQIQKETLAKADAAALVAQAKAEAEAISIKAKAEAEAIELKAEAEAKRAKLLAATPLGAQLSLLSVYGEMAAKSDEGVQKVVYSDLQANNVGLLSMPSLAMLTKDLEGLSSLGGTGA
jgi:regulator of protease activity HflC (stomatin/prohibitin superfamily)